MKFVMCSVLDMKSGVFLAPFVARSIVDAERQIAASLRDPAIRETPVGQNPEDFALYHLGEYDDELGAISGAPTPKLISPILGLMKAPSTVGS